MFGVEAKVGLTSSSLRDEIISKISTEDDQLQKRRKISKICIATSVVLFDFNGHRTTNFVILSW
jgi:hypothetical protein